MRHYNDPRNKFHFAPAPPPRKKKKKTNYTDTTSIYSPPVPQTPGPDTPGRMLAFPPQNDEEENNIKYQDTLLRREKRVQAVEEYLITPQAKQMSNSELGSILPTKSLARRSRQSLASNYSNTFQGKKESLNTEITNGNPKFILQMGEFEQVKENKDTLEEIYLNSIE
eukprot:snap_masked-scaffold_67-processed-gene-0.74-mRNA-1 protein AED:1.00 eAED:1.00 QI:0/0/0/0.5/1/1/2/0/167